MSFINSKLCVCGALAALLISAHPVRGAETPPAPAQPAPQGELVNLAGTALVINSDAVTSSEIINQSKEQLSAIDRTMPFEQYVAAARPMINKAVMENIYKLLLYQHAKSLLEKNENFEPIIKGALDKEKKVILARYDGSAARAQKELALQGKTLDGELENVRHELTITSFRETFFTPTLTITRTQLLQYYQKNKESKYVKTPSIRFQLIEIPFSAFENQAASKDRAKELALESAQQASQAIAQGEDFTVAVAKFSHGFRKQQDGLWPAMNPDSLQEQYKPLVAALNKIQPGRCTDILELKDRFILAKLMDRKDARTVSFAEAQPLIEEEIRKERWQKFSMNLAEKLFKTASVGQVDRFVLQTSVIAYKKLNAGS